MPYTTEIIENGKGILHVGTVRVTGSDLMSSASTVFNFVQKGLRPEYGLTDLSDVTDSAVSAVEIEKNAALNSDIARHLPSIRLAIVAPTDNIFSMVRMWLAHRDKTGWTSRVFRSKAEALAWLKQGPDI